MNKDCPVVSVVITAYNEERFIGRCLRSLLNQNLDNQFYEVIVVDDASGDRTPYALEIFGDAIVGITNEENLGLPASINKGISVARGEYIVRVDADDYVNANFLSLLKLFLDENPDIDAIACDYLVVDDTENIIDKVNCADHPIGCGIMFKKVHLIEIGMYDETFKRHEDKDLRLRFEKTRTVFRLELPLYRYRKHENNITNDQESMQNHMERLKIKHGLF